MARSSPWLTSRTCILKIERRIINSGTNIGAGTTLHLQAAEPSESSLDNTKLDL